MKKPTVYYVAAILSFITAVIDFATKSYLYGAIWAVLGTVFLVTAIVRTKK